MADVLQTLAAAPAPATDPMGSEARKSAYRIAELLSQQGLDTSPISSPWQGLARMAQAAFGGWDRSLLDKEERGQTAAYRKLLDQDPRLATGETPAPRDRVAAALAGMPGLTPPAPREGDAVIPRMTTPPAPREGVLPPPTSNPRPPTAPPLIQQPVRQATEGVMPADGLPGSGYGDDSYRMPLDQMRPPQGSVRQAFAGPGATGPTPSPAPANSMTPLPGSDAPIVPKQVQAVPVQPPAAPAAAPAQPGGPGTPGTQTPQLNRVPTQMTPQIAQYIRQLRATNNPAALAQAEALTQQYSKPTEYDFKVVGDKLVRTDKLGNHTIVGDASKPPAAIEEVEYAKKNWQNLGFPDPASTDTRSQEFWRDYNAKRLGGNASQVTVNADKSGAELMAKKGIEGFETAQNNMVAAQKRIAGYGGLLTAMKGFSPGASADIVLQAKRWLKDASFIKDVGVSDAETFKSIGRRLELAATPKGQGSITENERGLIREQLPTMTTSPEGIVKAVQMLDRLDRYDVEVARIYRENATAPGNNGVPNYLQVSQKIADLGPPMTEQEMVELQIMRENKTQIPGPNINGPAILDKLGAGGVDISKLAKEQFGGDVNKAYDAALMAIIKRRGPEFLKQITGGQ